MIILTLISSGIFFGLNGYLISRFWLYKTQNHSETMLSAIVLSTAINTIAVYLLSKTTSKIPTLTNILFLCLCVSALILIIGSIRNHYAR